MRLAASSSERQQCRQQRQRACQDKHRQPAQCCGAVDGVWADVVEFDTECQQAGRNTYT